jgi:uncharacterized membrane protein AbrB (regulator of aidB expression)
MAREEQTMKSKSHYIFVTIVTVLLAGFLSSMLHWTMGTMLLAGLAWTVVDDWRSEKSRVS